MKHPQSITLLVSQTLSLYRTHLNALFVQHNIDLTSEMSGVLIFLWESDRKKQNELADYLYKDKGGITKIIDGLEKRGLVARQADALDGRNKIVALTQAGRDLKQKVLPIRNKLLAKMTNQISKYKLNIAQQVLTAIVEHLK